MEFTLQHPVNFRDMGGLPAAEGRLLKPRRLLRCGEVTGLSPEEIRALSQDYAVRRILDLRTAGEATHGPDQDVPGAVYERIDFQDEIPGFKASQTDLTALRDPADVDQFMLELYDGFVTSPATRRGLRRFLTCLLENREGSVLFHCYAGKDRTGVSAAAILTLLGASRETIMADYLRTNIQRRAANEAMVEGLLQKGMPAGARDAVLRAMYVDESYLLRTFAAAQREYGSFDAFLREGVGVTTEEQGALREMYLA